MPAPYDDTTLLKALQAKHDADGNVSEAARKLEVAESTLRGHIKAANERFPNWRPDEVAVAALPPEDLPFEERLETMKKRNSLRIAHARAIAWQTVRIPIDGPYGITWFGDPHMDDPFCDLVALERHAKIVANTEGMFGANGGDSINNWVGRLERIYAEQATTATEGWELVDWFMNELGIRWLLWILGNHDVWNFGKKIFEKTNAQGILMRDWDAKLRLIAPNGGECSVWARHDFKGSSIYNELHGLKRASMMDEPADIYAAFHRHNWGTAQGEMHNGRKYTLIRAKGYKESDDYGLKLQFHDQLEGQSVATIITPRTGLPPLVNAFENIEEAADFLTFKRRKAAA